jgi:hypothetical protein
LDNSIVTNCASKVWAAWVASGLKLAVGEGFLGAEDAVTVKVREGVFVGEEVNVEVLEGDAITEAVSVGA